MGGNHPLMLWLEPCKGWVRVRGTCKEGVGTGKGYV